MLNDTIVAIATSLIDSSIGVIRISGDKAKAILSQIFLSKSGKRIEEYHPRQMMYGHIIENSDTLDEVLAVYMKGPLTYTAEDIVEIHCHGGYVPLQRVLDYIVRSGARIANPGEFTQRAFLNGRLDLSQAEAVMDIVKAKTDTSFDMAYKQLEGYVSKKVNKIRYSLMEIMSVIEVNIDYPDEDIEEITYKEIIDNLNSNIESVEHMIFNSKSAKVIREGVKIAIIGKPNVGKSSLLNVLLNDSRAIVTDIPGTTRDIIEEHLSIKGIPIRLIDTAGIRETTDVVEKMGVDRSIEALKSADFVIAVFDVTQESDEFDRKIYDSILSKNYVVFMNKSDLTELNLSTLNFSPEKIVVGSAKEEKNIRNLENKIHDMIIDKQFQLEESEYVTNSRHIDALNNALLHLQNALKAAKDNMPLEFVVFDINLGYENLGKIVGETVDENLMNEIFSKFCLGK
jgi:tRNA modification GTPase